MFLIFTLLFSRILNLIAAVSLIRRTDVDMLHTKNNVVRS